MIARPIQISAIALFVAFFTTSCGVMKPTAKVGPDGKPINPYPAGSYENFTWDPGYPKTSNVWKNEQLLAETSPKNSHIKIDIAKQRGFLMNGDEIVIDYPICSGTKERPTPRGKFKVLEKIPEKRSNLYGRIYDAEGKCVTTDADMLKDTVPEGGRFEGAPMNNWMRLTSDGVGHHIGPVLRYPASHSCVRGPKGMMPTIFSKVAVGTPVEIE